MYQVLSKLERQWEYHRHEIPQQWWHLVITPLLLCLVGLMFYPFPDTHVINSDPATFYYGGNLLTNGYTPYLHLWDVKPPAIYDTTALISLISSDPWAQFYIGALLSSAMAIGAIVLAGTIVYKITKHNIAALATSVSLLAYPQFIVLSSVGVWTKFFALFFGLLGIYCLLSERYILAAVFSTLAPGYWQFGVIFAVIVLVGAWVYNAKLWKVVTAMILTTLIVVAPVVLLGGLESMIHQVVFTPLEMSDQSKGLFERFQKFQKIVQQSWPLYYGGAFCLLYLLTQRNDLWWLGLGFGWAALQIGFLDFDASPDPLMFVLFISIGIGLFIGTLNRRQQVAVTFVIGTLMMGQLIPFHGKFLGEPNTEYRDAPQINHFLEQRFPPSTCAISYGGIPLNERLNNPEQYPRTCEPSSNVGPT